MSAAGPGRGFLIQTKQDVLLRVNGSGGPLMLLRKKSDKKNEQFTLPKEK
jgi:hypothetical protein